MTTATAPVAAPAVRRKKESLFRQVCLRLLHSPVPMIGLAILLIMVIACICAPLIAPFEPTYMDYSALNATPNSVHILGCDQLGRDIFSRILYGGRLSISLGLICSIVTAIFGVIFGCLVGYAGGATDNIVMRICDIWMAIPGMLLCILLSTALGNGFFNTILAMTIGGIPGSIRSTRAMALKEREMEYLEAAKAMNCSRAKILYKHMMPNIIAPTIVGTTGQIGGTIMQAASLSYIGLGIPQSSPEWGSMCSAAKDYILTYPHMIIWPGLAILITVLAINMFGDGLRDAMDPRLKD